MVSSVKEIDTAGTGSVVTPAPVMAGPAGSAVAAELLAAMGAVRRTSRRAGRHASAAEPLPPARSELLRLAARRPGITVAEAARELRLAPNTVSTMVGDLTSQGLISRGRSSADGRAVRLTVTARARPRLAQWRDLRAELTARALAGLDQPDQETLTAAIPALIRLAEQMEEP
jgi:DNA-binding MarR family transcriptional regulator